MNHSPLRRKTPIRKRRPGTRRGQPTPAEKSAIQLKFYQRAGGCCELRLMPGCIPGVLPWDGPTPWSHGHLVHLRSRALGGWGEQPPLGMLALSSGGDAQQRTQRSITRPGWALQKGSKWASQTQDRVLLIMGTPWTCGASTDSRKKEQSRCAQSAMKSRRPSAMG